MRRLVAALLAGGVSGLGVVATPAAADTPPQACPGDLISFAVQALGGRRAVADTFFGDYPQAVQDAQAFMKQYYPARLRQGFG